jgi:hypothetical protein
MAVQHRAKDHVAARRLREDQVATALRPQARAGEHSGGASTQRVHRGAYADLVPAELRQDVDETRITLCRQSPTSRRPSSRTAHRANHDLLCPCDTPRIRGFMNQITARSLARDRSGGLHAGVRRPWHLAVRPVTPRPARLPTVGMQSGVSRRGSAEMSSPSLRVPRSGLRAEYG